MPAVSYDRIRTFLQIWEAVLDEPASVMFVPSLDNLVELAIFEMNRLYGTNPTGTIRTRNMPYLGKLLQEIERDLREDKNNPIIKIMGLECNTQFTSLMTQLAPTQTRFDLARVYPLLQAVSGAPSEQLLQRELAKELTTVRPLKRSWLTALTRLLLRKVLIRLGASHLKLLPRKQLSQRYVQAWLPPLAEALAANNDVNNLINDVIEEVFLTSAREPDLSQQPEAHASEYALWNLLTEVPDYLVPTIRQRLVAHPADADPIGTLLQDENLVEAFGYRMLQVYLDHWFTIFFRAMGWHEESQRESRFEQLSDAMGGVLLAAGNLQDNRQGHAHIRPNVQKFLARDALTNPIASIFMRRCSANFRPEEWRTLAIELSRSILTVVQADAQEHEIDWLSSTDGSVKRLLYASTAKRLLHNSVQELLQPIRSFCIAQVAVLAHGPFLPLTVDEKSRFWSEWTDSFVEHVPTHHNIFDFLPWTTLSVREFKAYIAGLFRELFGTKSEHIVIQRANDIDPESALWFTGNMIFYDPRAYNFGEDRGSVAASILNDEGEDAVGIAVFVRAYSRYDAQQIALQNSKDALHVLSYAFSVSQRAGGFRARLARGVATCSVATHAWVIASPNERADQYDVVRARSERVPFYAKHYDKIVTLSSLPPYALNPLQQAFLESLHWYVRGRWNRDAVERFLFHWIGLEHLFAEGKKKDALFETLPRLYLAWMDVGGIQNFHRLRRELLTTMIGDAYLSYRADRSVALRDWREDYRVLMAPYKGSVLTRLFTGASVEAQEKLAQYNAELLTLLKAKKKIEKALKFDRDTFEFKLRLLYRWRNQLAHEAAPYRPGMEFYAREIEAILEKILIRLATECLRPQPICTSVDDVIELYKGRFK